MYTYLVPCLTGNAATTYSLVPSPLRSTVIFVPPGKTISQRSSPSRFHRNFFFSDVPGGQSTDSFPPPGTIASQRFSPTCFHCNFVFFGIPGGHRSSTSPSPLSGCAFTSSSTASAVFISRAAPGSLNSRRSFVGIVFPRVVPGNGLPSGPFRSSARVSSAQSVLATIRIIPLQRAFILTFYTSVHMKRELQLSSDI